MEFKGISRTFSAIDEKQYETIGAFWMHCKEMNRKRSILYGRIKGFLQSFMVE